ncbi:MAG TPA: protein kinase [Microlunatus sp.]|nr:protein kinase [Microlunatus sp.]
MAGPGALIADRYRLVRELGTGGMGVVWEARDERLHRRVAVKQLRNQPGLTEAETDVVVQRAMREARINARLEHPNAVSVFDVVEHEGNPCIVMELVPSMPLSEVMRELGALAPAEAARTGSQVAAALAVAHGLGIVHRDVKPGNVLIGDDGAARICDFGISRAFGDTALTMTGMITGTPAYLAPEVARGEEATFASDVYSLGATLYAAVEGTPPFGTEGNAIAVLYRVTAGELRPPERAGALGPLLVAMMSADPQDRPSMAEAATRLAALVNGAAGTVRSGTAGPGTAAESTLLLPAGGGPPDPVSAPTPRLPSAAASDARTQPPAVGPARPADINPAQPAAAGPARPPGEPPAVIPAPSVGVEDHTGPPVAAPPKPRRRRGLVIATVVLVVLLGALAVALLVTQERPTAGTGSTPPAPSTTRSSESPAEPTNRSGEPTTAELSQAVIDYYALLPDDTDAGWERLTASYQGQTGGKDSYEDFWKDIDTVTVSDVSATAPDRVQATVDYVEKSGNRQSSERRSFRLVRSGDVLAIDQSSVI